MHSFEEVKKPESTNPVVIALKKAFDCLKDGRGAECDKWLEKAEALADEQNTHGN